MPPAFAEKTLNGAANPLYVGMRYGGLVADYAVGMLNVVVTGLSSSTSCAFAVVVKDAAGNGSLYAPATVMTLDVSAPTVGIAISVGNTTTSALTLSWGAATDDLTSREISSTRS